MTRRDKVNGAEWNDGERLKEEEKGEKDAKTTGEGEKIDHKIEKVMRKGSGVERQGKKEKEDNDA